MIRATILLPCAVLLLGACRQDSAALPDPVPLTPEAVGYFCQMNLLEHDGPKAQLYLKQFPQPLFFSQVRDAIAYQRMPEQQGEILGIYVNDMGAKGASWAEPGKRNWIRADAAVYVVGSRRKGGMGAPELVPFADPEKAEAFAAANGGRVQRLPQIPDAEVLGQPESADGSEQGGASAAGDDYGARLRALGI